MRNLMTHDLAFLILFVCLRGRLGFFSQETAFVLALALVF